MAERAIVPGRVLAGRYRLETKLGEGGFGTIWRAEHLVLCAPVAVKIIDREVGKDEEALARFMREARAAATLRSPHVVQILDYGVDDGVPYIAMELLEGETLAQRLSRVTRLGPAETTVAVAHVARAIGKAHDAGIVHRDLKPENVFIVHNEDAEIMKVLDFGVAKVNTADLGPKGTRTRTGSLLGTPYYMSPEQAQGNKTVDHRTDLWALGVIAFECLTGTRPFESEGLGDLVLQICVRPLPNPSELAPVPKGFDAWFQKACAREPADRFQTAREMVEALRISLGVEGRETFAQLPESDTDASSGRLRLASSPRAVKVEEPTPRPRALENADTIVVPTPRRAAATLGQFGTTHGAPEKPQNRTALVISVGGLALLIGMGAGFAVLKQRSAPVEPETVAAEPTTAAEPSASADPADPAASVALPVPSGSGELPTTEEVVNDAGKVVTVAKDAGRTTVAAKDPSKPDKSDKPKKDAGPRDWGKVDPEEGQSIFEPVPPAPPPESPPPAGPY